MNMYYNNFSRAHPILIKKTKNVVVQVVVPVFKIKIGLCLNLLHLRNSAQFKVNQFYDFFVIEQQTDTLLFMYSSSLKL